MDSIICATSDVLVVDPRPQDYEKLVSSESHRNLRIQFVTSGDEALRSATAFFDRLWLINTRLPDMTGVDLLLLIRDRNPNAIVFLVGDSHDQEDEILARSAGPTAYVCKPPHPVWLDEVNTIARASPPLCMPRERAVTQASAYY